MNNRHSAYRLRGFLKEDGSTELIFGEELIVPQGKVIFDSWIEQTSTAVPYAMQDTPVATLIELPAIPEAPAVPDVPVEAAPEPGV